MGKWKLWQLPDFLSKRKGSLNLSWFTDSVQVLHIWIHSYSFRAYIIEGKNLLNIPTESMWSVNCLVELLAAPVDMESCLEWVEELLVLY